MNAIKTAIDGVWILEPKVFGDHRGYFFESFNQDAFNQATGLGIAFIQDNQSRSKYGVLRGLHFQHEPYAQSKLVRCSEGVVLDVAVDIRKNSPTFGKHVSVILSAENKRQLFVPKGFAHGFVVLSEYATLLYKCDALYAPQADGGLAYNDPALAIDWQIPAHHIVLSEKDAKHPVLSLLNTSFSI